MAAWWKEKVSRQVISGSAHSLSAAPPRGNNSSLIIHHSSLILSLEWVKKSCSGNSSLITHHSSLIPFSPNKINGKLITHHSSFITQKIFPGVLALVCAFCYTNHRRSQSRRSLHILWGVPIVNVRGRNGGDIRKVKLMKKLMFAAAALAAGIAVADVTSANVVG